MPPFWLWAFAIAFLSLAVLCFLLIGVDILLGRPQKMAVMNLVWPITALYFGPVAVLVYWKTRRPPTRAEQQRQMQQQKEQHQRQHQATEQHQQQERQEQDQEQHRKQNSDNPSWQSVFVSVCHCGAGCTLGDIIGEWIVFLAALTILGAALWPEYIADYLLAYALGILFQFLAIAPMRQLGPKEGIWEAIKADTLSLTFFEIGLFGWMAISHFLLFPRLHPDDPAYWLMMQIGMMLGFLTSFPVNWWLVKRGIKEAM